MNVRETLRRWSDGRDTMPRALEPFPAYGPAWSSAQPSELLSPYARVVAERGRHGDLQAIGRWLASPGPRLLSITGEALVGKTRLAVELANRPPSGWSVVRVRAGRAAAAAGELPRVDRPTAVVLDDVAADDLVVVLSALAGTTADVPVRAIVLTRTDHWIELLRTRVTAGAQRLLEETVSLRLRPVGDHADLVRWYDEAVGAFVAASGTGAAAAGHRGLLRVGLPLGVLHEQALAQVLSGTDLTESACSRLAAYERRQWAHCPVGEIVRDRCVATLLLLGVGTGPDAEAQATGLLAAVAELDGDAERRSVAQWVLTQFSIACRDGARVASMPLSEDLVLQPLLSNRALWEAVSSLVDAGRLPRVLGILAGAGGHADDEKLQKLLPLLRRAGAGASEQDMASCVDSIVISGMPAAADQLLATLLRDGLLPDSLHPVLGALAGSGRDFPTIGVELSRLRVERARNAPPGPELGDSLRAFACYARRAACGADAVAAAEESVAVLRAAAGPPSALAAALQELANGLRGLDLQPGAAAAAAEAVSVWRLAPAEPAPLATALQELAADLIRLGRQSEAVAAAEESAALWRRTQQRPDHELGLAAAVSVLAVALDRSGAAQPAMTAAAESRQLWRTIAADETAGRLELAATTHNLALICAGAGSRAEAVAAAEETVDLWRMMAVGDPALRPDLADALRSLALACGQRVLPRRSLAAAEESVRIWTELAEEGVYCHSELGRARSTLAVAQEQVDRWERAIAENADDAGWRDREDRAADRVVAWRAPAAHEPRLGLPLAWALSEQAQLLTVSCDYDRALESAVEAVTLLRPFAATVAERAEDLTTALHTEAVLFDRLGRYAEAVSAAGELLQRREDTAGRQPTAHLDREVAAHLLAAVTQRAADAEETAVAGIRSGEPPRPGRQLRPCPPLPAPRPIDPRRTDEAGGAGRHNGATRVLNREEQVRRDLDEARHAELMAFLREQAHAHKPARAHGNYAFEVSPEYPTVDGPEASEVARAFVGNFQRVRAVQWDPVHRRTILEYDDGRIIDIPPAARPDPDLGREI